MRCAGRGTRPLSCLPPCLLVALRSRAAAAMDFFSASAWSRASAAGVLRPAAGLKHACARVLAFQLRRLVNSGFSMRKRAKSFSARSVARSNSSSCASGSNKKSAAKAPRAAAAGFAPATAHHRTRSPARVEKRAVEMHHSELVGGQAGRNTPGRAQSLRGSRCPVAAARSAHSQPGPCSPAPGVSGDAARIMAAPTRADSWISSRTR